VIKAICVPKVYSRSEIDKTIIPLAQQKGVKGVAWLSYSAAEGWKGSILKFFDEGKLEELKTRVTQPARLNFYAQNTFAAIKNGTKTIETRALNPDEPERYFGNINV
jgi:aspartyl-tRNA synthetase